MTIGARAIMWGSATRGCQLWVLVGTSVYSQSGVKPTSVMYKKKNPTRKKGLLGRDKCTKKRKVKYITIGASHIL